jgi:parallel beta-helix repeat protein
MLRVLRVSNEEVLMKSIATMLIVLGLILLADSVESRPWYITPDGSGDAPTIQAGITAAGTGDIVLLAPGTYTGVGNRDIDFLGKAITVTSESGRDVTIIDCLGLGVGFQFYTNEGPSSVLSGVTIRNGNSLGEGGGIYCHSSSPTITNNTISGNSAATLGGGIVCYSASPTMTYNIISGNSASWGGAIACINACPTISSNTISDNSASYGSGGIYCVESSPSITSNTISNNSAPSGGGIYCDTYCSPTITNNIIEMNSAVVMGGAGGGIYCAYSSSATIINNTISQNSASLGGGIYCFKSSPSIQNTIISFNGTGGGIYCDGWSNPTVTNCDIYGNVGGDAPCGADGGGSISADPLFCDPNNGNFSLNCTSPCANNPGYGQIGAFGVGCGLTAIEHTTWGRIKSMFR